MNVQIIVLAVLLAGAGVGVGVYNAGTAPEGGASDQTGGWTDPAAPENYAAAAPQFVQELENGGIFPLPPRAAEPAAAAEVVDATPKFPTILSVARIDGRATAFLLDASGVRTSAHAGDELEGGWVIESISLKQIVAKRDGEEHAIDVYPRNDAGPQ